MPVELLSSRAALDLFAERFEQLCDTAPLPIEYGGHPDDEKNQDLILPEDHPFVQMVMEMVNTPEVAAVLERLSERFLSEGKYLKPTEVRLAVLNTGTRKDSAFVRFGEDKVRRTIYLTLGSLYYINRILKESLGGKKLKKGHILGTYLHEYLHPLKFEGHPEEYNADRASVIAMIELGYDPQDRIEVMQAYDLMTEHHGVGFRTSHPFSHSRIAFMLETIDEVYAAQPHLLESVLRDEEIPEEVLHSIFDNAELLRDELQKKALFSLPSPELRQQLLQATTFSAFWDAYLAFDVRQNAERAVAYAQTSSHAYHLSKLLLVGRAVRMFTKVQEKKQEYLRAGQAVPPEMIAELMDETHGRQLNGNTSESWEASHPELLLQEDDGRLFRGVAEYLKPELPEDVVPQELPIAEVYEIRLCYLTDILRALYGKYVRGSEYQEEPHLERAALLKPLSQWLKNYYSVRWPNTQPPKERIQRPTEDLDYNFATSFFDSSIGPVGLAEFHEFEQLLYRTCISTIEQIAAQYHPESEEAAQFRLLASELAQLAHEAATDQVSPDLLPEALYDWSLPDQGGPFGQQLEASQYALRRKIGYGSTFFSPQKRLLTPELHAHAHLSIGAVLSIVSTEKFASLEEFATRGAELLAQTPEFHGLSVQLLAAWFEGIARNDFRTVEVIAEQEVRSDAANGTTLLRMLEKIDQPDFLKTSLETGADEFLPEYGATWLQEHMKYASRPHSRYASRTLSRSALYFKSACLTGYLKATLSGGVIVHNQDGELDYNQTMYNIIRSDESCRVLLPIRELFKKDPHWDHLHKQLEEGTYADTRRFRDLYRQLSAQNIDKPDQKIVTELQTVCKALKVSYLYQAQLRPTIKQLGVLIRAGVLTVGESSHDGLGISHLLESRASIQQFDNRSTQTKRMAIEVLRAAYQKYLDALADDDAQKFRSFYTRREYEQKFWWFASFLTTEFRTVPSTSAHKETERADIALPLNDFYAFILKHQLPIPTSMWMNDAFVSSLFATPAQVTDHFVEEAEAQKLFIPEHNDEHYSSRRGITDLPMRTQDVLGLYATAQHLGWPVAVENPKKLMRELRDVVTDWHKNQTARMNLFYLLSGGSVQELEEHYAPLNRELQFEDFASVDEYLEALHVAQERRPKLRIQLPVQLQEKVIARFGGLRRAGDFQKLLDTVTENYPYPGPFQDELMAYCWSLFDASADRRRKSEIQSASAALLQRLSGKDWGTVTRNSTKADEAIYIRNSKKWKARFRSHTIGEKFFAEEIFERVGTRRFAYETALEFPFAVERDDDDDEGEGMQDFVNMNASFLEYFLARRLLVIDTELQDLLATDVRAAIAQVREVTRGVRCAVADVYIEYFIRQSVQRDDLTLDDARYLYDQYMQMLPDSARRSYLAAPLLRKRIDSDPQFFDQVDTALAVILEYLPEGGYERNEFLLELQTHAQVTVDDIRKIQAEVVDVTGIRKEKDEERRKVTIFDMIGDLASDQKGELLFYLIDEKSPKPSGTLFRRFEESVNGSLADARQSFVVASVTERNQIIQRLVYGPDATLSLPHSADGDMKHPSVTAEVVASRQDFSEKLAHVFIPDDAEATAQYIVTYRELLSAALVSMDPLKASNVVSNIVNKMIELDRQGKKLAVEDMLYIAVLSFGSVGIKSAQLVADYPWVPEEIREVFKQGLWNAEIVPPAELMKVFEYEQTHLGHFKGLSIKRFVKPLGSAGICQAYLAEVEQQLDDGRTQMRQMVIKAVKPGVIGMKQVARDIRDLQRFLTELQQRGYSLDIPADFTDIITTIILEERKKSNEAAYFAEYQATNDQRSVQFDTPEVFAVGQFMIFVELVEGEVLADAQPEDFELMQLLMGAFQDLQIGVLNLDDHVGNFIRLRPGQDHQLSSIDGGFTIDLRQTPELHLVVQQLVLSLLSGDGARTRPAMYALGLDGELADNFAGDMAEKIEAFRQVFFRAPKTEHTVLLHKLLWWMYRKLSLYHQSSPFLQQMISGTFS